MNDNVLYSREVTIRDANHTSFDISIEILKRQNERKRRDTLEPITDDRELTIYGTYGNGGGQCCDAIEPRTKTQKELMALWDKYHLNGMSAGSDVQVEYLEGKYIADYEKFISLFAGYDKNFREHFDSITWGIFVKAFGIDEAAQIQVRNVLHLYMDHNPIKYILGLNPSDRGHDNTDYYVKCLFLAINGIYNDRGHKYGKGWCGYELAENIEEIVDSLCDRLEEEEDALTEELEAVFDMGAKDFVANREIIDQVMTLRDCDEDEAIRFVALGMHLGVTFGDLNDTFEESRYNRFSYSANGYDYYVGSDEELHGEALYQVHNDSEYEYFWREAVAAERTTDGLNDWLDSIVSCDGWESVLNRYDGSYSSYQVLGEQVFVCRT